MSLIRRQVSSLLHKEHICTFLYFHARHCLHGVQAQSTAEVEADFVPLSTDTTTEPEPVLDLRAHFGSKEDMLQYIAGFWEADGGMVMMNGSLRLYFHQSNKAFLESLQAEYGASGVYYELPKTDGTVEWGRYSNGELC